MRVRKKQQPGTADFADFADYHDGIGNAYEPQIAWTSHEVLARRLMFVTSIPKAVSA
jgi:hypothetical protein